MGMRKPLAALAALAGIGMLAAPTAGADPTPSVPGDPTGPIYNPPGYIGYYPGAYGFQSIWSLTPPSRFVDGGNTGARSNADPQASGTGMPGDRLGVQDNRAVVKGIGPSSQVRGVRTGKAVPSSAQEDNAGGVLPGATAATGQAGSIVSSNLGDVEATVNRPDGKDADHFVMRPLYPGVTREVMHKADGVLAIGSGRINGEVFLVFLSYQPGRNNSDHELRQTVSELLADFSLTWSTPWPAA